MSSRDDKLSSLQSASAPGDFAKKALSFAALMVAFVPIILDMTILHVATPTLTRVLNASATDTLWIIDIYPLVMAGLIIPMGTLADKVGAKKLLLVGLAMFALFSGLASYSQTSAFLISCRALMAVGASMVLPSSLSLIRQIFEDQNERGLALGIWSTVFSISGAVGPLVGGWILEHYNWGAIFLVNVFIFFIIWPLNLFFIPRSKSNKVEGWNIGQALVLLLGLVSILYSIKSLIKPDRNLSQIIGIALIGIFALYLFLKEQRNSKNPLLDLSLFKSPAIFFGLIIGIVISASMSGMELTLSQELQFVYKLTPLNAGLFMMPLMIGSAIGGPFASTILSRVGLQKICTYSLVVDALCMAGLAFADLSHISLFTITVLAVLGVSLSVGMTGSSIAIMGSAPKEKSGAAGAIEGFGMEIGTTLGVTFFGVLLSSVYQLVLDVPSQIVQLIPENSFQSIHDTLRAANVLENEWSPVLRQAGQLAFISAHKFVLMVAFIAIAVLSGFVYVGLKDYRLVELNSEKK